MSYEPKNGIKKPLPPAIDTDALLDEALEETFPASDPIAIHAITLPSDPAPQRRRKARGHKRPSARKTKKRPDPKTRSRKKAGKKRPARRVAGKKNRSTR